MAKKPGRAYPTITVKDRVWRVLAPRWAQAPLSGNGAAVNGGRFNRPGVAAFYTSFDLMTAIVEYQQEFGARPGTFCPYDASIRPIVDLTDGKLLSTLKITTADLNCPWKEIAWVKNQDPPTWLLADRLIGDGVAGIKVPSSQHPIGFNLVLWKWADAKTRAMTVLDPIGDLPANQDAWP